MPSGEGSFLNKFYAATKGMSPEEVGKYLEDPPEGAPDIEAAHQVRAGRQGVKPHTQRQA